MNTLARLEYWRATQATSDRRFRQIGNARLATGIIAVVVAAMAIGVGWISPWWLLVPVVVFIALAIVHDRVDKERASAARGAAYSDRALSRVENRWIGNGRQGEEFRDRSTCMQTI
jgi:fatty acid desaturase